MNFNVNVTNVHLSSEIILNCFHRADILSSEHLKISKDLKSNLPKDYTYIIGGVKISNMGADSRDDDNLHKIFKEIGEFKIYQVLMVISLVVPCLLSAGFAYQFVFTSATLDYR